MGYNVDVVKFKFEDNLTSELSSYLNEQLKVPVPRVFMKLDPTMWVADGFNSVFSGIGLRRISHPTVVTPVTSLKS